MAASFKLILVPLDSTPADVSPYIFTTRIVSTLEFPAGPISPATIDSTINVHPLLTLAGTAIIRANALPYNVWLTTGRAVTNTTPGVIPVVLTYADTQPLATLLRNLALYFTRPSEINVAQLLHDSRFDALQQDDLLDIAQTHRDLSSIRAELQIAAARKFGLSDAIGFQSYTPDTFLPDQVRWLNAHVQAQLLDQLFDRPGAQTTTLANEAVTALARIKSSMSKLEKRLTPNSFATRALLTTLWSTAADGKTEVSAQDPNVAAHAALKNGVIAENCGFLTTWRAEAASPLVGDYVITIEQSNFNVPAEIAALTTQQTAVRRRSHTHPLSFADAQRAETTNCGLALLNTIGGTPRYSASAINTETHIVQNTLLQANNSISNSVLSPADAGGDYFSSRDDRPPELLADEQFGISEPETGGLTLSAPSSDLATPAALAVPERSTNFPCLFLEDLWVGYRLDIGESGGAPLLSVHKQMQEITFAASQAKVSGATEEFIAREQSGDPITSTELYTYTGMSSAQRDDYMRFLGTYVPPKYDFALPFTVRILSYSNATPLRFKRIYRYRLRNVFLGGTSFSDHDPRLAELGDGYEQLFPFFRARAYRPGEVVRPENKPSVVPGGSGRKLFLSQNNPRESLWIVPTPIDSDSARYHGHFLSRSTEPERNSHRAFISDVARFFVEHSIKSQYYVDPDVSEISVRLKLLNGDPTSTDRAFTYRNGAYCELARHFSLRPVKAKFGPNEKWEKFSPIQITFSITQDRQPSISHSDHRRVRVLIPPGGDIEVSLLPIVTAEKLRETAAFVDSSTQLAIRRAGDEWAPTAGVVEHKIRAVHCVQKPVVSPTFGILQSQPSHDGRQIVIAQRARHKETAELKGYLQLDAASTGQVRLEASWSDIDDNPQYDRFVVNVANTKTKPHSVGFGRYTPPSGAVLARASVADATALMNGAIAKLVEQFDLQCAENKIFLGTVVPPATAGSPTHAMSPCIMDFGDTRRKRARVRIVAVSRFKEQFDKGRPEHFERMSDAVSVEVPSSMVLPAPEISHVIPLSHSSSSADGATSLHKRSYAFRIFVRRPWFLSGPGERLAVGCYAGQHNHGPVQTLNKYMTQWGEDPIERPKLEVTKRLPRASDFRAPDSRIEDQLDDSLYPLHGLEGGGGNLSGQRISWFKGNGPRSGRFIASELRSFFR